MAHSNETREAYQYFTRLIETIPVKYLAEKEDSSDEDASQSGAMTSGSSKYYVNKKQQKKSAKLLFKEASKQAKRIKLNPELNKRMNRDEDEDEEEEQEQEQEQELGQGNMKNKLHVSAMEAMSNGTPMSTNLSVSDLRARLHDKINELKSKRNVNGSSIYKKDAEQKRLYREAQKKQKSLQKRGPAMSKPKPKPGPNATAAPAFVKDNGKMIFSKFELGPSGSEKKKSLHPKQAIEKLMKQNEKLEKLKETNPEKAKTIIEKQAWQSASLKARGEKVKDDPKLLKKSIKKIEKRKFKSQKEWSDRHDKTKESKALKQKIRNDNIEKRKEPEKENPTKSGGQEKPKGQSVPHIKAKAKAKRPGFEGVQFRKKTK